ncbi:CREB5 protein, partial [Atractosteus spatula]|nr:CREB5 protein [Atractosteus spatula]
MMNLEQERPFVCNAPGCSQRFPTEDHLMIHRHKHEMTLKFPSIKNDNILSDQTPTPTRFLKNCEEVGLFNELDCSIEQEFRKAQEEEDSKQNISLHSTAGPSPHQPAQARMPNHDTSIVIQQALPSPQSSSVITQAPSTNRQIGRQGISFNSNWVQSQVGASDVPCSNSFLKCPRSTQPAFQMSTRGSSFRGIDFCLSLQPSNESQNHTGDVKWYFSHSVSRRCQFGDHQLLPLDLQVLAEAFVSHPVVPRYCTLASRFQQVRHCTCHLEFLIIDTIVEMLDSAFCGLFYSHPLTCGGSIIICQLLSESFLTLTIMLMLLLILFSVRSLLTFKSCLNKSEKAETFFRHMCITINSSVILSTSFCTHTVQNHTFHKWLSPELFMLDAYFCFTRPVPGSLSSLLHLRNRQRQPLPASMPGTLPDPPMPGSSAVLMPMERQMPMGSSIMGIQGPNLNNSCSSSQVPTMHSEAKLRLKAALTHHPAAMPNGTMNTMGHMMEMIHPAHHQSSPHQPLHSGAQSQAADLRTLVMYRFQTRERGVSRATHQMQPTQTLQPPQAAGGRRRRVVDEDPDERRRKFLERNRAAATRCRQKRKVWVMSLEKKAEELTQTNMQLQVWAIRPENSPPGSPAAVCSQQQVIQHNTITTSTTVVGEAVGSAALNQLTNHRTDMNPIL